MCPLVFPSPEHDESSLKFGRQREAPPRRRSKSPIAIPFYETSANVRVSDRAGLIGRIKAGEIPAGENPTWLSNGTDYYQDNEEQTSIGENDRPRSALHSGVFAEDETHRHAGSSPPPPCFPLRSPFPPSPSPLPLPPLAIESNHNALGESYPSRRFYRSPSISAMSSFVFKAPTSPLVYSSNSELMDAEPTSPRMTKPIDIKPRAQPILQSALSSPQLSLSCVTGQTPSFPRHSTFSSFSSKRKSMTDAWNTGFQDRRHSRRSSLGVGHGSDMPHGSFVGSYEESILNGRMSTTPSKPLNFVAQIGVLGIGKCKPSLRCPIHLTITFPAYFYSVGDYDSPSPYVGQIDLETALAEKSGRKFPGYRIPEKGQLQIVIKNPNKTAVKLFLVPYDLRDMPPGTKTFVRQKSFALNNSVLADSLGNSLVSQSKLNEKDRESLRYLIHLHICCPSKGRFYLYRTIRVVFANRVPDGKEKLRNEILHPDPKYSA